jgi:hypothetical protein
MTSNDTETKLAQADPVPLFPGGCKGLTKHGQRCAHRAKQNGYCHRHGGKRFQTPQSNDAPPRNPSPADAQ